MNGTEFREFKDKLLENPEIKSHYDSLTPKYDLISALIERRSELAISQRELARLSGLKQPARLPVWRNR